ncbi:uncharacterized protein J4E79_009989 [Alternaria viburni]|uniref:uncharacterized protein n=1 Tax=Alternaria viburni TaxID=566460 RepID=UPI0020C33B5B|nr:uncharacterized protein J4E79_009989 [Alternaria viburni]KAI4648367.1 hypothetical protein J4E79_009989 [Alternaria viburni]
MLTVDSYLKALLALSGNEQLATPRQHLLQGINDEDLSELLKKAVAREFARGGLEDIVSVILDVIARDPDSVNGDGSSVARATASVKIEQDQGNGAQQQSENDIMVMSDQPASGRPASDRPATPATSVSSKREPPLSPGSVISKRSRVNAPTVVATQAGASAKMISLRDCEKEQMIDNKIVPPIKIAVWQVYYVGFAFHYNEYKGLDPATLFSSKFAEDYLSTDLHILEWGKRKY